MDAGPTPTMKDIKTAKNTVRKISGVFYLQAPSSQRSPFNPCIHTWLFLTGFGHVGNAGVRAHEDVAGVQRPLQEELLGV